MHQATRPARPYPGARLSGTRSVKRRPLPLAAALRLPIRRVLRVAIGIIQHVQGERRAVCQNDGDSHDAIPRIGDTCHAQIDRSRHALVRAKRTHKQEEKNSARDYCGGPSSPRGEPQHSGLGCAHLVRVGFAGGRYSGPASNAADGCRVSPSLCNGREMRNAPH